jgi:hypothetical protein
MKMTEGKLRGAEEGIDEGKEDVKEVLPVYQTNLKRKSRWEST